MLRTSASRHRHFVAEICWNIFCNPNVYIKTRSARIFLENTSIVFIQGWDALNFLKPNFPGCPIYLRVSTRRNGEQQEAFGLPPISPVQQHRHLSAKSPQSLSATGRQKFCRTCKKLSGLCRHVKFVRMQN